MSESNAQVASPQDTEKASKRKKVSPLERRLESFAAHTEERIDGLVNVVERLGALLSNVVEVSDHKPAATQEAPKAQSKNLSSIIPPEWREIIDRELGPDFDAEVMASSDGLVLLHIYSPDRWDTRKGDEKVLSKRDTRVAPISRGSAVADVEKWVGRFAANIRSTYKHFSPTK